MKRVAVVALIFSVVLNVALIWRHRPPPITESRLADDNEAARVAINILRQRGDEDVAEYEKRGWYQFVIEAKRHRCVLLRLKPRYGWLENRNRDRILCFDNASGKFVPDLP